MSPHRRAPKYRCTFCGVVLPAWIPVPGEVDAAMLIYHLSRRHPDYVGHYLEQMHDDEDIAEVVAQAFEVIEGHDRQ